MQPPDPLELWESDPFEPEIRGDYLYGRGTVDDKGQLYMLLAAARELARAGELPVNVRFCCDGEEETGGHSIVEFLEADERGADAAIIFDSGMIRRDVPAFNLATRGMAYFHVTLRTGERDLHSGMYGGAALNAAHALIKTLDALIAHDGTLVEPLRKGIAAPTEEELAGWAQLPAGADELAEQGARAKDASAAEDFYLRTFAEPALDVNGIATGSPQLQKTVLPGRGGRERVDQARARPEGGGDRARGRAPPAGSGARRRGARGRALVVGAAGARAAGRAGGAARARRVRAGARPRPALIRSGGTLPIVPALADKGIPTVITGFGLPDSQIHSPNERLVAEYVPLGHRGRARALPRVRGARSFLNAATADRRPAVAGRSGGEARRLLS